MPTHTAENSKRHSDWRHDGHTGVMYNNAHKPNLKGGAAWFLGTKYYSE